MKYAAIALSTMICLFNHQVAPAAEPPLNVVFILVDDLGWMDLSCQGSDYYRTPNIDKLANQGMRFTDAYAACAVCILRGSRATNRFSMARLSSCSVLGIVRACTPKY